MTRRPTPYPFLALVVTALTLNVQVTWGQAPSQADFISIDCGASKAYTDPVTGINWVPDGNYTVVGTNKAMVPRATALSNNSELQTLRYFTEPRKKFCYELPVQLNQTYLVAAMFWYGNYDGLNKPPVFNMAIDATEVLGIDLTDSLYSTQVMRHEYIRMVGPEQTSMSVCFYQDSKSLTTPFVSSLELRLLNPGAYVQPWLNDGNFLFMLLRQDFGGERTIRYPDDAYDRVWKPFLVDGTTTISSTLPVLDPGLSIKPPSAVLQTAITPTDLSNLVIPYEYGTGTETFNCVYYLYLAELNSTATATSRPFIVTTPNDPPWVDTLNIYNSTGGVNKAFVYYWKNMTISPTSDVILSSPTPKPIDPPIVSGAELYVKYPTLILPTNADDAAAIDTIKVAMDLTGWSGDPCLPVPYDWVACGDTTSPRVLKVNLNGYNLTGEIPVAFAQLTALTSLRLSDNSLSGSIPESLATLPALKELLLSNNNLTGTVPTGLQKPGLAVDIRGNPVCNCGPVPVAPSPSSTSATKKSSNTGVIAGVVGGILAVVLIGILLGLWCCCRTRKPAKHDEVQELPTHQFQNGIGAKGKGNGHGHGNGAAAMVDGNMPGAKPYSLAEMKAATQNFSRKIGEGGFGPVYYGKLAGGKQVAIKVSDVNSRQGVNEFNNEVQLLSRVHHKNLVSLVGYCLEGKNQMLVYEYLHRGTVREHLYGSPLALQEPLDWKVRLDIALNSAQGLEYLHGGCTPSIIHRDVKSSNILLTEKYVPKVADFGLSRLGPEEGEASHVSTLVKGTAGYLDPEYWSTNNLTEKSDVYSFGVVLLELLCGRQPIDNTLEDRSHWNLSDKVRKYLQAGDIDNILDPVVKSCHPNMDSVWKVAEIAIQSVEPKGVHRPFMRDVVRELREAIVLESGLSHASSDHSSNASTFHGHGPRPSPRVDNYSNSSASDFEQYKQGPLVR